MDPGENTQVMENRAWGLVLPEEGLDHVVWWYHREGEKWCAVLAYCYAITTMKLATTLGFF